MDEVKIEPSADMRQFAAHLWQQYVALTQEGFSEKQAIQILGTVLSSVVRGRDDR